MATQHPFLTTTKFIVVCFKFKVLFLAKAVNINKDESPHPPPQKYKKKFHSRRGKTHKFLQDAEHAIVSFYIYDSDY